jgi:hypothetical protein
MLEKPVSGAFCVAGAGKSSNDMRGNARVAPSDGGGGAKSDSGDGGGAKGISDVGELFEAEGAPKMSLPWVNASVAPGSG